MSRGLELNRFYSDQAIAVYYAPCVLMHKTMPPVADAFANASDDLAGFLALRGSLSSLTQFALSLRQCLFVLTEEPGVGDHLAIRQYGELLHPDVDTHHFVACG